MQTAMSPVAIAEAQGDPHSFGRFPLPRAKAVSSVAAEIRRAFMDAGLEIVEQQIKTLVPFTERREIRLDFNGKIDRRSRQSKCIPDAEPPAAGGDSRSGDDGATARAHAGVLATAYDLHDDRILDAGPGGVDPAYGLLPRYARLG